VKAAVVTTYDGPSAVELRDVADPDEGGDTVVIDVHAAGVNFPDLLQTRGLYQWKPDLPFVLGGEVAGVVRYAPTRASVGVGDRVVALCARGGGMAERVGVPVDAVFRLPDVLSLESAAGLVVNDLTMHFALTDRLRLSPGAQVLVHGAAGGIGTSALRIASALGAARLIAVVSNAAKGETAKLAGATEVVLLDDWLAKVRELTAGRGVDVLVDPVGGDRFTDSLRALARGGSLLVVGFADGQIPTVAVNRLLLKNIAVFGVAWGEWVAANPGYLGSQWNAYCELLASGRLQVLTPTTYPFASVREALTDLENRSARGKIVLTVR
jgi:NADPH2:quinone reductase